MPRHFSLWFSSAFLRLILGAFGLVFGSLHPAQANIPGGGTGSGPNITLTGTGTTATMSNGTVSIVMTKSSAQITAINYTFNNTGNSQTLNLLSGNSNGGKLYWEHSNNQGLVFTDYTVVADPASNGGDYSEISVSSTTQANMPFAVIYSMRRGSPGFYVTAIWTHGSANGAFSMGECRNNIYAGSIFNWMSVDATRNKLMQVSGGTSIGVPTAPAECSLWTNGIYQGQYEDKYKYSATWGDQRVWGWSSVGASGKNVGLWNILASSEYYNGGPLHPELMCHIGTTILNMFNGSHYAMGSDGTFVSGELWGKVCGPYLVYCNQVSKTITDPVQVSQALYNDALAQGAAEASAWPYSWFSNPNYANAANRGTVTGKIVINDTSNPNATASNLWVGLIQQPLTSTGTYDFQQWMKPYQFWVHTDANGNFAVPAVIAGSNYTLYAFGQGATGTFMSQAQTGGNPPFLANIPALPFSVTVNGGATTALGNVTWTPTRVGPTVFEIGYPDRTARKFKHGEDWWVGDIGPSTTSPSPVWSKWLEFPFDFPNGLNYTVGTSRWTTDWNFVQPVIQGSSGTWNSSSSTITFNLAAAPASGTQASIYLGLASDYYTALIVTVNGSNLASGAGLTATPSPLPSTGFVPTSSKSDSSIREACNGAFSDERLTFAGTLLKAGTNTITLSQRQVGGSYFADHAMYDYLRLELTNYVPPAPGVVSAVTGNNCALVSWPAVPGATSYNVLRSTNSSGGYSAVATGVIGPVSGSGLTNAVFVDSTAINGTTYYYIVQSTNPVNSSANSPPSAGVMPSASVALVSPSTPIGLVATSGTRAITLSWSASSGAKYYTVKRSTLTFNGGGSYNTLNTIPLTNSVSGTSYTDTSPTNGSIYSYTVAATSAAGSSSSSTAVIATASDDAPLAGPATVTATALQNSSAGDVTITWPAVTGAVGYVVKRANSATGTYTLLFTVASLTVTDYSASTNATYYYQVAAMTSGGTSPFVISNVTTTPPAAPTNLVATPDRSRITVTWTAPAGAMSYEISRATVTGGPYTNIATGVLATPFVDQTVSEGITYYYVIAATGAGGTGDRSLEAFASVIGIPLRTWTGSVNTIWNTTSANWLGNGISAVYADGQDVTFNDTATAYNVEISGTVTPDDVVFNNSASYNFTAAGLSGPTTLTKLGSGTLAISGTNNFTGGTLIQGGVIMVAGGSGNMQNGLGTGMITLDGGTLVMNGYTGSNSLNYGTLANNLYIPGASVGTLKVTQRGAQSGTVTGAGTLGLQVNYVRGDLSGDWSAFTGQINVTRTSSGTTVDHFRINKNTGFGTAAVHLGPYVEATTVINANNTFTIGELSGDATSKLAGVIYNNNVPGAYTATYVIGGRNTDATFAGTITNGTSPSLTAITKQGGGIWTLNGTHTYTGPTVINEGTLNIVGSLSNTNSITVTSGATLILNSGSSLTTGAITNQGIIRRVGTSILSNTGTFTNNGVLDLINGPQTLPAHFINQGIVLDSSLVKIDGISFSGANVFIAIHSYIGHIYQLQGAVALTSSSWQNAGTSQAGTGGVLTLTETGGSGNTHRFYRVVVTASP